MAGSGQLPSSDEHLIDGGKVMSVFDHLAELRTRIVRSLLAVAVTFFASFAFASHIVNYLKGPLLDALPNSNTNLHFTGPMDVFLVYIKVSLLTGVIFSSPVWMYQFWKFFEPALYPKERKYIIPFAFASLALFLAGVAFCYFVILPLTLTYLLSMGLEVGIPMITIKDYVSLLMLLIFGFGIVFETPVIIVLLALLDILTLEGLRAARKYIFIVILVISAILTPPDPVSQVALALPVYIMYEIALVIIAMLKRKPASAAGAAP